MASGIAALITIAQFVTRGRRGRQRARRVRGVPDPVGAIPEWLPALPRTEFGALQDSFRELPVCSSDVFRRGIRELGRYHPRLAGELFRECLIPSLSPKETSLVHLFLGLCAARLASMEEALGHYNVALESAQGAADRELEANAMLHRGAVQARMGRLEDGFCDVERALGLFRREDDAEGEVASLCQLCRLYRLKGLLKKAAVFGGEALKLAQSRADEAAEADALLEVGVVTQYLGDAPAALDAFQRALELHQRTGRKLGMADDITRLGALHVNRGAIDLAMRYYEQALTVYVSSADLLGEVNVKVDLGYAQYLKGDLDAALASSYDALELSERIGFLWGESHALCTAAMILAQKGDFDLALEYYQRSATIHRTIGDAWGEAQALNNAAIIHSERGDLSVACSYYQRAAAIFRELGHARSEGATLTNMGLLLAEQGHLSGARLQHLAALALLKKCGDQVGVACARNNLGEVYLQEGNLEKAQIEFEAATAAPGISGIPALHGYATGNLASLLLCLGRTEEARHCFECSIEALQRAGDVRGEAETLTKYALSLGDPRGKEAQELLCTASDIFTKHKLRSAWVTKAREALLDDSLVKPAGQQTRSESTSPH